jgi:dihydroxyacetone kinase
MLDESRREKDIMRANCVNRKLTEVNANTRNIDQRSRALKDAASSGDDARRSHEYTVLTVLAQKLDQLDQEATQCLGQSVYEPGASQVVTTISEGSPTTNPSTIDPATAAPPSITVPPPNLVPDEMSPAR